MAYQFSQITLLEAEIANQIKDLEEEARLVKLVRLLYNKRHVFNPTTVITRKNLKKFAVLSVISSLLEKTSYRRRYGASQNDLLAELNRLSLNIEPTTLRSHLLRFKREGRLYQDSRTAKWLTNKGAVL